MSRETRDTAGETPALPNPQSAIGNSCPPAAPHPHPPAKTLGTLGTLGKAWTKPDRPAKSGTSNIEPPSPRLRRSSHRTLNIESGAGVHREKREICEIGMSTGETGISPLGRRAPCPFPFSRFSRFSRFHSPRPFRTPPRRAETPRHSSKSDGGSLGGGGTPHFSGLDLTQPSLESPR
jgi:hypothetical protein